MPNTRKNGIHGFPIFQTLGILKEPRHCDIPPFANVFLKAYNNNDTAHGHVHTLLLRLPVL